MSTLSKTSGCGKAAKFNTIYSNTVTVNVEAFNSLGCSGRVDTVISKGSGIPVEIIISAEY